MMVSQSSVVLLTAKAVACNTFLRDHSCRSRGWFVLLRAWLALSIPAADGSAASACAHTRSPALREVASCSLPPELKGQLRVGSRLPFATSKSQVVWQKGCVSQSWGEGAAVTPGAASKQVAVPQQARGSSPPLFTARGLFLAHFLTKQAACGTLRCFVCWFELKVFSPLSPATLLMKFA